MRKLALLAAAGAAALSLSACGKADEANSTATDALANDADTGTEIVTDENAFATENLGDSPTNVGTSADDVAINNAATAPGTANAL